MCAAGRNHSLFLTEVGSVWVAGFNEFGQLGTEQSDDQRNNNLKKGNSDGTRSGGCEAINDLAYDVARHNYLKNNFLSLKK